MNTLYGLNNCDTCKKARNWLQRFSIEFQFVDYRDQRLSPEQLNAFAEKAGGFASMINKASTTWRQLPEPRKNPGSGPEWQLLLKEYPALIKRPLLTNNDQFVMQGFSDNTYKKHFGISK
jgi:Spx/MgsR family transcriptional regulator